METRWLDELLAARGLSREILERRKVRGEHRHEIAQKIGKYWETFASHIEVSQVDVDDIKEEHRLPADRRFALMKRWHELCGSEATYLKLINGLIQVGRRDLTEHLLEQLSCTTKSKPKLASHTLNDSNNHNHKSLRAVNRSEIHNIHLDKTSFCRYSLVCLVVIIMLLVLGVVVFSSLVARKGINTTNELQLYTNIDKKSSAQCHTYPGNSIQSKAPSGSNDSCDPPVWDLPTINHELFIGRKNDISMVIGMMENECIININGAPGIGKSALAIHVGYEMVRKGSSARYINVDEKLSLFNDKINSKKKFNRKVVPDHGSIAEFSPNSLQTNNDANKSVSHSETFIQELQKWSDNISCPTLLILDNCDDILVSSFRDEFISLIYSLIDRSHLKLHIIVVSTEKLVLLKGFNHWTVRELSLSASVQFLDKLAPAIDRSYLIAVAEIVEGNPLALKVIGKLLHLHGDYNLVQEIKEELKQNPLKVLDEVSLQKERFRTILDMAFGRLGVLKNCGYILGLFPGSFDTNASKAITSVDCFKLYKRYSLLDDFQLAHHHRHKMHRLLKEYVKEKLSSSDEVIFNYRFEVYYRRFLLKYAIRNGFDALNRYSLSLETHNFDLLKSLLLQRKQLSAKQLACLAFLVSENLLELKRLHKYFDMYLDKLGDVCQLLSQATCGEFYYNVVTHSYQKCKYKTLAEYIQNIFHSPGTNNIFECAVVDQIDTVCRCKDTVREMLCTRLSSEEKAFLKFVRKTYQCFSGRFQWYDCDQFNSFAANIAYIVLLPMFILALCIFCYNINNMPCAICSFYWLMLLLVTGLCIFVIFQLLDVVCVLSDFSSPIFVQRASRKICVGLSTVLFLCILLLLLRCWPCNIYQKTRKIYKVIIFVCSVVMLFSCTLASLSIDKIQLFMCQFVPTCA